MIYQIPVGKGRSIFVGIQKIEWTELLWKQSISISNTSSMVLGHQNTVENASNYWVDRIKVMWVSSDEGWRVWCVSIVCVLVSVRVYICVAGLMARQQFNKRSCDSITRLLSEDSGFESQAGFILTRWPNGKASDYEFFCNFFLSATTFGFCFIHKNQHTQKSTPSHTLPSNEESPMLSTSR